MQSKMVLSIPHPFVVCLSATDANFEPVNSNIVLVFTVTLHGKILLLVKVRSYRDRANQIEAAFQTFGHGCSEVRQLQSPAMIRELSSAL
jgi:hypothetical protein